MPPYGSAVGLATLFVSQEITTEVRFHYAMLARIHRRQTRKAAWVKKERWSGPQQNLFLSIAGGGRVN
jgi:hypothetical protein